jgi:rhomboid protease GluP
MATEKDSAFAGELFYASNDSQLGKARRWLWLTGLISIAGVLAGARGSLPGMMIAGGLVLVVFVVIDIYFSRQLRAGRAVVAITDEWIESPVFSSTQKRFLWNEIAGASLESTQGAPWLELQLTDSTGLSDRKSFWTGRNEARPSLLLTRFAADEQVRLAAAIEQRLNALNSVSEGSASVMRNSVAEEAEFQERLRQLAPIPWMLWLIVAANVLIWIATAVYGGNVLQNSAEKLLGWGGNAASEVQRGDWWRLLSATFLHGGLMHLVMNMIGLVSAGIVVERIYGHRLFLLLYIGSGLLGSALSLHFSAQAAVSVGASGAVFGVTGALLVAVFQHRDSLPKAFGKQTLSTLGIFIVYALMQGFAKQGIDNAAHIGGLVGGCLLAYLLPERFDMAHFTRNFRARAAAGVVLVLVATTGVAAMAPRAAIDQKRLFESQALFPRGIANFEAALKALQQEALAVKGGKMSERESDGRSRSVHAPAFRSALDDLAAVYLRPGDPREPLLREVRRMTELFVESLEMQSVYQEGSDRPEPVNPERMAAIEVELKAVDARIGKLAEEAKTKAKR